MEKNLNIFSYIYQYMYIYMYVYVYIYITESLCCTPETTTTLYINYTSIF